MKKTPLLFLASTLLIGSISQLHAQLLNGSFSTGDFTSWNVLGGAEVITSSTTLPSGVTAPTLPAGATAQAWVQSTNSGDGFASVSAATIDAALNTTLPPTEITNPLDGVVGTQFSADEGQAIYQTFSVGAGQSLTFDFSYATNDSSPYDSVGYVLDGVYTQLVATPEYSPANATPTSYVALAPLTLTTGTHTLAFVAYNTGDPTPGTPLDSTSIFVTGATTTPEPSTWSLLVFAGAGLIAARMLRRRFGRV